VRGPNIAWECLNIPADLPTMVRELSVTYLEAVLGTEVLEVRKLFGADGVADLTRRVETRGHNAGDLHVGGSNGADG